MTPDATRPVDGGHGHNVGADIDLLVGLWEEARFARLPWDAPSELRDLVEDIDSPKRVYAVHRASRRHNFQSLVQKFIVQLREGCGADFCQTPTCFTCRKRLAGRAPIRRYNTTSARTLATYLATQDNPENGLCPALKPPKGPPAAVNSLLFHPVAHLRGPAPTSRGSSTKGGDSRNGLQSNPVRVRGESFSGGSESSAKGESRRSSVSGGDQDSKEPREPRFSMSEQPASKDYRSFAANVFGTVAFKMLEWLTPAAIDEMSKKARPFQGSTDGTDQDGDGPSARPENDATPCRPSSGRDSVLSATEPAGDPKHKIISEQNGRAAREKGDKASRDFKQDAQQREPGPVPMQRRNSNAKVRTSSGPRPKRPLSIDPFSPDSLSDDPFSGLLRSPRANSGSQDKSTRGIKTTNATLSRPISQLSSAGYFDDVSLEKMPPPRTVDFKLKVGRTQLEGARSTGSSSPSDAVASGVASERSCSNSSTREADGESEDDEQAFYPQTLSKLDADLVDFICDTIQADGTAEQHMLEPATVRKFHTREGLGKPLKRRSHAVRASSANPKLEWRLFVEQTLFYVLSDADLAVSSFSANGRLYDSQTLWYCMLRMTRIAPSLVFESLWVAAGSLFSPPKFLQSLRSSTTRLFPKSERPLSNVEAGRLLSICLHALIAAAPLVKDSRQLSEMSRIRAHGLTLGGSGSVAHQPTSLCLQYEDAFTDELAIRLARRLFSAIITRRCYDEMAELNSTNGGAKEQDVLVPLFSQLDLPSVDCVYILNFSINDRAVHEHRVPILLLDWARAVMLHDWDGSPEVPGDGPFGGALALMDAIYKKRHDLALPRAQFRAEYFADRLDTVLMPVAWLTHKSTRQKAHLLDFPFMFSSATLVSYFRSINFARMSRTFEESTSLQETVEMLAARSGLSLHYKDILTDRIRAAGAKYLVLDIKRERVLRDAFDQLWRREARELLRPLKVHLGERNGEEGFDSGGVQQEFFRMAIAEALNPKYGAFTVDEVTRMAWFVPGSMEPEWKFELVGLLVSLAVYNGLTLPVTFPKALYRKLLGKPITELHHIADGWPEKASGLTKLLEWDEKDGMVEDVFTLTYEFSVEVFGQRITREMKPLADGASSSSDSSSTDDEWPQFPELASQSANRPAPQAGNPDLDAAPMVTNENRNAYVSDYIRYLTDVSVRRQFDAFARGFHACLHPKSLSLLTPNILQSVVEGVQEIDISELRQYTRYVGWDANHPTIRDFWSIVKRYDDNMKRKLLEFVTASDRVPVGGVKNMMFILQKNGTEDEPNGRLPTSYTCYGTLLLPQYQDRETLRERLGMALENAQGFGFA
ncbi:ubiquitin-protein ligase E3A [Podospora aff. communis PSN243]|uniref:HECT-type E3 ubiquitin transferase n=1 Tax=Podospora aff. communis PSN243 TaxID=3040156 RepID=A0AAV9H0L4_9PEZI|nr:ubiquitin-protein ligase E3A [Podospora aff. communis PSN243]